MKREILDAALFTPIEGGAWGLPLMLWGPPGAAKSDVAESVSDMYIDLPMEVLSPSERGDGAFGVIGVPSYSDKERDAFVARLQMEGEPAEVIQAASRLLAPDLLTYPRPDWTTKFDGSQRGVLFLDELPTASPIVQPAMLGLIRRRRIGAHTLPPGVRVIAAGNPPNMVGGGYEFTSAVANRMGHLEWDPPTVDEHVAYMMGLSSAATAPRPTAKAADREAEVMKAWPEAFARAVGLETAFISRFVGLKHKLPDAGSRAAGRAWPSDRSWVNATRALASSFVHGLSAMATEEFVSSYVGHEAGEQFFGWLEKQDMPDPAKVLDGSVKFTHEPVRVDRTVALLGACVALVAPSLADKRTPRAQTLWGLLDDILSSGADADICVAPASALMKAKLRSGKGFTGALTKLNPILDRTGSV